MTAITVPVMFLVRELEHDERLVWIIGGRMGGVSSTCTYHLPIDLYGELEQPKVSSVLQSGLGVSVLRLARWAKLRTV